MMGYGLRCIHLFTTLLLEECSYHYVIIMVLTIDEILFIYTQARLLKMIITMIFSSCGFLFKINLRYGLDESLKQHNFTCTACAGTHLLEFAALSRVTGNHTYEVLTCTTS